MSVIVLDKARDGAVPAPYIVPVSAILQRPDLRPLSYDGALELFSRPLMQQYAAQWSFGPDQRGEDGVIYNLQFEGYRDALHAWRYPDLTRHVSFTAATLEQTIEQEMRAEAQSLQSHRAARERLKTSSKDPTRRSTASSARSVNPAAQSVENYGLRRQFATRPPPLKPAAERAPTPAIEWPDPAYP